MKRRLAIKRLVLEQCDFIRIQNCLDGERERTAVLEQCDFIRIQNF